MQVLKKQISSKLEIIQKSNQNQDNEQKKRFGLGQLLQMKKKQHANQSNQDRLIHNFLQIRINESMVQSFYSDSLFIMKKCDKKFTEQSITKKKKASFIDSSPLKRKRSAEEKSAQYYEKTINLYVKFFKEQDCQQRATEILYMFQKNICDRQVLLPTIFSWLFQWIRKRYMKFLKAKLSEVDNRAQRIELIKKKRIKMMSQISPESNSDFVSHDNQSNIKLQKKKAPLTKEKSLSFLNKQMIDISQIKSLQLLHQDSNSRLNKGETINNTSNTKSLKQQSWYFVNKEILLGVIHEDLQIFYQYYGETIIDLDSNMLKNIRKFSTRKLSLLINLDKVVEIICSKQLASYKKSITTYSRSWNDKFNKDISSPDKLKSISQSKSLEKNMRKKTSTKKQRQQITYQSYTKFLQSKQIASKSNFQQKLEDSNNTMIQSETQRYQDKIIQQSDDQYKYSQSQSLLLKFPKKQKPRALKSPDRYRQQKSRISKKRQNALSFQELSSSKLSDEFKNINKYLQIIKVGKGIVEVAPTNRYGSFKKSYKSKINQDPMKKQMIYNMLKAVGLKQPKRSISLIVQQQRLFSDEYQMAQKLQKIANSKGVFYLPKIN